MPPDSDEVLTRWAPDPDLTVRYGPHPDQVADVRLPPGAPVGPLVVFIHGGFWRARYDRAHTGPLAADLAGRGYPVAAIGYRRVGQDGGGWPGTLDDVAAAVARVPGLVAAATGLPLDRPVLSGHSAGGHLALWAGSAGRDLPVRRVVALAPVADLTLGYRLGLGAGAVVAFLGGPPEAVPDRYAAAQPGRPRVPTVILHGTDDDVVPVQVSRAYLAKAGDLAKLVEIPGAGHFAVIDPAARAWSTLLGTLGADTP
jgi:acetyl esterase/lipase